MANIKSNIISFRAKSKADVEFASQVARKIAWERHEDVLIADMVSEWFYMHLDEMKQKYPDVAAEYYSNDAEPGNPEKILSSKEKQLLVNGIHDMI